MRISDWSSDVCSSDLIGKLRIGLAVDVEWLGLRHEPRHALEFGRIEFGLQRAVGNRLREFDLGEHQLFHHPISATDQLYLDRHGGLGIGPDLISVTIFLALLDSDAATDETGNVSSRGTG